MAFELGKIRLDGRLFLIAGPCAIESEKTTFVTAERLKKITERLNLPFIFKASYDKANRTSVDSPRGVGIKKGLEILKRIKQEFDILTLTDIHCVNQAEEAASVVDIIQIPAFLCRQTDLIKKASKLAKAINIKKGQFISPYQMKYIVEKAESVGQKNILLTERGFCFGYENLVVDFRSFVILKKLGYPVVFDVTHSLQRPGSRQTTGYSIEFAAPLLRAAVACGIDGIFIETHPNPQFAISDKDTQIPLDMIENLLKEAIVIYETLKREKLS